MGLNKVVQGLRRFAKVFNIFYRLSSSASHQRFPLNLGKHRNLPAQAVLTAILATARALLSVVFLQISQRTSHFSTN